MRCHSVDDGRQMYSMPMYYLAFKIRSLWIRVVTVDGVSEACLSFFNQYLCFMRPCSLDSQGKVN